MFIKMKINKMNMNGVASRNNNKMMDLVDYCNYHCCCDRANGQNKSCYTSMYFLPGDRFKLCWKIIQTLISYSI